MPEGCRCFHNCSDSSPPLATPSCTPSSENAEPPFATRKKRRINADTPQTDLHKRPMRGYQDRPIAVEERPRPRGRVRRPAETQTSAPSAVQAPSDEKSDNDRSAVACRYFGKSQSGSSGAAALATTLSTISTTPSKERVGRKGIAPSITPPRIRAYATLDKRNSFISSRVVS